MLYTGVNSGSCILQSLNVLACASLSLLEIVLIFSLAVTCDGRLQISVCRVAALIVRIGPQADSNEMPAYHSKRCVHFAVKCLSLSIKDVFSLCKAG